MPPICQHTGGSGHSLPDKSQNILTHPIAHNDQTDNNLRPSSHPMIYNMFSHYQPMNWSIKMVIEVNCRNAADIRPISSFFFSLFRCLIYEVDRSNVNKLCHAFDCDPCTFIKSRQNFGVILQNIWQPHAGTSKLWRFHDLIANIFGTQQDDKRKTSLQTVITPTQGIYLIG